jgi:major membrane immunogen (membrane-anchored lipoprotein)
MRPVRTKGERRIGRAIRKLENSVELSDNECHAKKDEAKYHQKTQQAQADSPVQNLRVLANKKKDQPNQ